MSPLPRSQRELSTSPPTGMKVCLVGIDGLRTDLGFDPDLAPNLSHLRERGLHAKLKMEVPTISGPGWGSLLTGASHDEHGVFDNSFVGSRLWHYPDFLAQGFYRDRTTSTFAAAGWPALVDPSGPGPVIHPRIEQALAGIHQVTVRDGETYGYRVIDAEIVATAISVLRLNAPDMSFIYMCATDEAAHVYGGLSEEYKQAIRLADERLGDILKTIEYRRREHGEDWTIAVTTDHGHLDEGGHGGDTDQETESFFVVYGFDTTPPPLAEGFGPTDVAGYLVSLRHPEEDK